MKLSYWALLLVVTTVASLTISSGMNLTQEEYEQLQSMVDAPVWTLDGQQFLCKVVKVYDGDSIKCVIKYKDAFFKFDFRVNGIDTPEVSSGDVREFGAEVRDIVKNMILGKIVKVAAGESDKYGRILGDFTLLSDSG